MKKIGCLIFLLFLNNCAYNPVIDTAGRSGTFDEDKAKEITNDLQHCKTLAKDNTNKVYEGGKYFWNYYVRAYTLWISPKAEYNYKKIYKNCMTNRGHSVIH